MAYETIVIPKGTLLFRGIDDIATLTSDFAGMRDENNFCLHKNFNVFFFPFPFVSNSVQRYKYAVMFVTTRDLKLVNLIMPSKFTRQDRLSEKGGIVSCNRRKMGCETRGRDYDPCVDYDVVSRDVSGMLAIANTDATTLKLSKAIFEQWENKYFTTYKDARDIVGVPEFVLHPRMDKTERNERIDDFEPWYRANKRDFNYIYLHVMLDESKDIEALMDEFMSEDGLDLGDEHPYHLKLNKKTGFFQIEEFSSNHSELISPNLAVKPTADMVLSRKKIYKKITDKYPKANTIPAVLNAYDRKDKFVELDEDALKWLLNFTDVGGLEISYINEPGKHQYTPVRPYLIDGKFYGFLLTPRGKEIENEAYDTNDQVFLEKVLVKGHPINSQISAYELTPPEKLHGTYTLTNIPAPQINGLLQYYAQKRGLLGASRRRTLRRSRLLKTR